MLGWGELEPRRETTVELKFQVLSVRQSASLVALAVAMASFPKSIAWSLALDQA